jgi:hypothetical protein
MVQNPRRLFSADGTISELRNRKEYRLGKKIMEVLQVLNDLDYIKPGDLLFTST